MFFILNTAETTLKCQTAIVKSPPACKGFTNSGAGLQNTLQEL